MYLNFATLSTYSKDFTLMLSAKINCLPDSSESIANLTASEKEQRLACL